MIIVVILSHYFISLKSSPSAQKQAAKKKIVSMQKNNVQNNPYTAVPASQGNGTNELWYTKQNNTWKTSMVHTYTRKRTLKKRETCCRTLPADGCITLLTKLGIGPIICPI